MKDLIEGLVAKFNARVDSDPELREELGNLKKTVLIEIKDGTKWHFTLERGHIGGIQDGDVASPDLTITVKDKETLRALLTREMGVYKAYALGLVRPKGSFEDLLRFRKFF